MIPRREVCLVIIAAGFLLSAPGSAHAGAHIAKHSDPELWVLLPCNFEEVPPKYMVDGAVAMDDALAAELARREMGFVQLSLVDGLRRCTRATNTVGGLIYSLEGIEQESVDRARQEFV